MVVGQEWGLKAFSKQWYGLHSSNPCRIYIQQSDTRLHCCPYMDRLRPFSRAHKREASGGLLRTKNSPKVSLKGCEKGPE